MTRPKDSLTKKKAAPLMRPSLQVDEVIRSIQQTERVIERLVFEKHMGGPTGFADTRHRTSE
jgi:hypothetical protein